MFYCDHHKTSVEVDKKTIKILKFVFVINFLLTVVEIFFGYMAKSTALIGDGLHNLGDSLSIMLLIIAFIMGSRIANKKYSYGFKRSEVLGSLINLFILFLSAIYLLFEGFSKMFNPSQIDGELVMVVAFIALVVNACTAFLLFKNAKSNTGIKIIFIHNFSDVIVSLGVILSGMFALILGWYFVDSVIAIMMAGYLLIQVVSNLPGIFNILMNASPDNLSIDDIKSKIMEVKGVVDVHHIHL